jgi:hypothetical protein
LEGEESSKAGIFHLRSKEMIKTIPAIRLLLKVLFFFSISITYFNNKYIVIGVVAEQRTVEYNPTKFIPKIPKMAITQEQQEQYLYILHSLLPLARLSFSYDTHKTTATQQQNTEKL